SPAASATRPACTAVVGPARGVGAVRFGLIGTGALPLLLPPPPQAVSNVTSRQQHQGGLGNALRAMESTFRERAACQYAPSPCRRPGLLFAGCFAVVLALQRPECGRPDRCRAPGSSTAGDLRLSERGTCAPNPARGCAKSARRSRPRRATRPGCPRTAATAGR